MQLAYILGKHPTFPGKSVSSPLFWVINSDFKIFTLLLTKKLYQKCIPSLYNILEHVIEVSKIKLAKQTATVVYNVYFV